MCQAMYREFRLQNTEEGVQVAMELTIYYKTCVQTTKQLKYSMPSGRIERCIKYYGNPENCMMHFAL